MVLRLKTAHTVLLLAFLVRLGGVGVTITTGLNPDAESDAVGFASRAAQIAEAQPSVWHFAENFVPMAQASAGSTYEFWGLFLAPFWFLPGPSLVYASVANAFLGAFAVYNVFLIGRHYHSQWAGILACTPLLIFPSFVAIHSTVLREAVMLFALTTIVRVLVVPGNRHLVVRYAIAIALVPLLIFFRIENAPFYLAMAGAGFVLVPIVYATTWPRALGVASLAGGVTVIYAYVSGILDSLNVAINEYYMSAIYPRVAEDVYRGEETLVDYIIFLREARLREDGRTTYHADIVPQTVPEMVDFAPTASVYFLFVPFPWMVESMIDLLVAVETAIMLVYAVFGVVGIWYLAKRNLPMTVALIAGLVSFSLFYGLVTVNVGTGMRHRQIMYWIIPLFGGIGIARLAEGRMYFRSIQQTWTGEPHERTATPHKRVQSDDKPVETPPPQAGE